MGLAHPGHETFNLGLMRFFDILEIKKLIKFDYSRK